MLGNLPVLSETGPMLASLTVLYVLLPLGLAVYYALPVRLRPGTLLGVSLLFYVFVAFGSLPVLAGCLLSDYAALLLMRRFGHSRRIRMGCVCFSVVKNLAFVFLSGALSQIGGTPVPLGMLVFALSSMECVVSFYRGGVPADIKFIPYSLHCCFFPKLFWGPLQSFEDFSRSAADLRWKPSMALDGAGRYIRGALKVSLLGRYLSDMVHSLARYSEAQVSVLSSWLLLLTLALAVYYHLSGYCDMARGIGELFGLRLPQNFYYPYQSRSVYDFICRFNSTVWKFLNRLVYSELQENRNGPRADALNLLVCGMLVGLWFGVRLNYLLWGAYLALFIILERYAYRGILDRIPTLLRRLYTLFLVLLGYAIFAGASPAASLGLAGNLFGLGGVAPVTSQVLELLSTNWFILLLGCFFSTNLCDLAATRLRSLSAKLYPVMAGAVSCVLLVVLTALLLV